MTTIAVIGAGIAGLAAAVDLVDGGHLVHVFESSDRIGGKLRTSNFAGVDHVDEGADAYLSRAPNAVAFASKVGVTDLTHPADVHAAVWHDGLHPLPAGIMLGVPSDWKGLATSKLLSWRGKLRAAADLVLPASDLSDDAIGAVIRRRLGDEVHDRLVDTLVGSIYATDTDRASLVANPQIDGLVRSSRSLILGARARRPSAPSDSPVFTAPRTGMAALAEAAANYISARGGRIATGTSVSSIAPCADGAGVTIDGERFDGAVVATPAHRAAEMVAGAELSRKLRAIPTADVAMVRLAIPAEQWPDVALGRSGYLVPKSKQRLVTAASFGSQKWQRWAHPDHHIVRASLGRDGLPVLHLTDDELADATVAELSHHLGVDITATHLEITRWKRGFPQYRPHHADLVHTIESALPTSIAVAGASYHGIGVPACIASGQRAAQRVVPVAMQNDQPPHRTE